MRWDALLVRALADELRNRLRGERASALAFDRPQATVALRSHSTVLVWDLRPDRGSVRIETAADRWKGNVPLPRGARIEDVGAADDERILTVRFEPGTPDAKPTASHALIIELIATRWNGIAVDAEGRIRAVLRARSEGARPLAPGQLYTPPPRAHRAGAATPPTWHEFQRVLADVPEDARERVLLASFAYTSPLNSAHVLGDDALDKAFARYIALVRGDARAPGVLLMKHGKQPYPVALAGVPREPAATLLDAFTAAAGTPPPVDAVAARVGALAWLRARLERSITRIDRLRAELENADAEAPALRKRADLLLSQLHRVRRGQAEVTLDDFAGGDITIALDPALAPAENARRLYDAARKRERAAASIPRLLRKAEADVANLAERIQRIERGDEVPESSARVARPKRRHARAEALPYRRYRTSSGLEVRVGRGAASNDALTLRHAAPDDIWMHARQVPGAHVVLRWGDRNANPPARDLLEAATLAAVHSRARTSGTVAVDWTRRKYVRKPRGAKPGLVMVERAKTLFVEPSAPLEKRLRWDTPEETER